MLSGNYLGIGFLLLLLCGCSGPDLVADRDNTIPGQDIRPYVGLIRNFSSLDISIPSEDSDATLILPSRGQMEYTVWKPNVKIFGYVEGNRVYYQSIRVEPKKYTFMGKSYDFLAEVCPEIPTPIMIPQKCPPQCLPEPKEEPRPRKRKRVCPT